jgi:WD40 repeat protein
LALKVKGLAIVTWGRKSVAGRRAVTIGVEQFAEPLERLAFAPALTAELGEALRALGYETTVHAAPELPSASLGAAIRQNLGTADAAGVLIVHVLSHGSAADGNASVYLLGSDGKAHPDTDVAHWLTTVHNVADGPLTLFLLDFCQSGVIARLPWQAAANRPLRGWVIAASRGDSPAYDGRFTRAVIHVLRQLAAGDLDIDSVLRHVPLPTVAQAIHREVNRLAAADDNYPQQVTASLVDISASMPDLPFFPNPAYRDDPRVRLRAEVDAGLLPFLDDLDEGLDARHFVERAAGAGPLPVEIQSLTGCFTGRADELRRLSPWLSGEGDTPVHVVTGSPGVGKSALLGVLVCAAHPLLREETRPLWARIAQFPLRLPHLAAVHARGRGVAEVTASLARQLVVQETGTPAALVAAVGGLPVRPVIVVDALDEADDGVTLMSELLLPIVSATRADGSFAARVLVGTRRYEEYSALLDAARTRGGLVDLDEVPQRTLEDDLLQYVTDLLRADPAYRSRGMGGVVGAFAAEVARVLSEQASEHREWGEFLVAGLYTRHLLTASPGTLTDSAEAQRLGAEVPLTLPEVLDLDLSAHAAGPLLRQVVTVLARARGQGMPLAVIARVVASSSDGSPAEAATVEDVRAALHAARFYIRQHTDIDGSALYRLFHQGLADYLRQQPAPDLLGRLLADLGPQGSRNWRAAEPYLLRHALDHALEAGDAGAVLNDPGFLLQPEPAILLSVLSGKLSDVYRASIGGGPNRPRPDRSLLALNAVRGGMPDLARATATLPGEPPLAWQPVWSIGKPGPQAAPSSPAAEDAGQATERPAADGAEDATQAAGETVMRHDGGVSALAAGQILGKSVIVTVGPTGTLLVWDLLTRQRVGSVMTVDDDMSRHRFQVSALAVGEFNSRLVAVAGVSAGSAGQVRICDLGAERRLSPPLTVHDGWVSALALGELRGRPVVVTGGQDGAVRVWDLDTWRQVGKSLTGHAGRVSALAFTLLDGKPLLVSGGADRTIRLWNLAARRPGGVVLGRHDDGVRKVAIGNAAEGDEWAAFSLGMDGTVRLWDLDTRRQADFVTTSDGKRATAMALGRLEGKPFVVTGDQDGAVRFWYQTGATFTGIPLGSHTAAITAAAIGDADGRRVAVTGSRDGVVQAWTLPPDQPPEPQPTLPPKVRLRYRLAYRDGKVPRPGTAGSTRASATRLSAAQQEALDRLTADATVVQAFAVTTVDSGTVGMLGTDDGEVAVVEAATGRLLARVAAGDLPAVTRISCAEIAGHTVATLVRPMGLRHVLDLSTWTIVSTGAIDDQVLHAPPPPVSALIVGRGSLLKVTGKQDGSIRVEGHDSVSRLPGRHAGAVTAVACAYLNGRPAAFTGGQDGAVMVWDLLDRRLLDVIAGFGPVFALWADNDGEFLVGAGGEVAAFRQASGSSGAAESAG